jgi:hypothetical protein
MPTLLSIVNAQSEAPIGNKLLCLLGVKWPKISIRFQWKIK